MYMTGFQCTLIAIGVLLSRCQRYLLRCGSLHHARRLRSTLAVVGVLTIFSLVPPATAIAIESSWPVQPQLTDWFGGAGWTNGIPNQPGDKAILAGTSINANAGLATMATIGELQFTGGANISLQGTGNLQFDNPVSLSPRLAALGLRNGVVFNIGVPIGISAGQELLLDVNSSSTLRLSGELKLGAESARKAGIGVATLLNASGNWTGKLLVDAGELRLEHTQALMNTSMVTVAPGGFFTVVSQDATTEVSREDYVIPRLILDHGTLQTNLRSNQDYTYLDADIELQSDSTIQVTSNDTLSIDGDISGPGGASFLKKIDPSSPVGTFDQTYLRINGNTSYSGATYIGPNMRVGFSRSAALGDTTAGTLVDQGKLELNQGGGAETIVVEQGELRLGAADVPYGHRVTLRGSQLSGGDELTAVLSTHVQYSEGAVFGTESSGDNLILAGGVSGTGSLAIQNDVEIQGGITARGNLYIRNRSGAKVSGPLNLDGEVFIDRFGLRLSGDIGSTDERFRLAPTFETADAALLFANSNTIGSLVVDPRNSNRVGTFDRTAVVAENNAVLTVADTIRFMGGLLRGKFAGQSVLTKQDRTVGIVENIAGSSFQLIEVEAGQLTVRGDTGATPPDINLQSHDTSRILLDNTGVYRGGVFLNDSPGYSSAAALTFSGNSSFEGHLFLGEKGSSVSGGGVSATASFGTNAVIHGGDLTLLGRGPIRIRGGEHTYSGKTNVMAESLVLVDSGRLNSTSAVVGSGRFSGGGGRANLVLDNSGTTAQSDRIPDSTPVYLEGMILKLIGRSSTQTSETLGTVHATRGIGDLIVESVNSPSSATELRIQSLVRQPGAAVQFRANNPAAKITIDNQPQLDDGLIGGWALYNAEEFATYGPNGVVPYSSLHTYTSNITTANASSNVRMDGDATLSSNKTINSLITDDSEIDLNGRTLTIESGGMLARSFRISTIRGAGQLTAGTEAGAELLVTGNYRIEANIVDNAQGAVGLTHSLGVLDNNAILVLSGVNTYSGPTVVNSGNSTAALELAASNCTTSRGRRVSQWRRSASELPGNIAAFGRTDGTA